MGAVREDMDDERDKHRETLCFASLCYVRDHSSTDVQSRHCPSRAATVAVRPYIDTRVAADVARITPASPFPTLGQQPSAPACSKLDGLALDHTNGSDAAKGGLRGTAGGALTIHCLTAA